MRNKTYIIYGSDEKYSSYDGYKEFEWRQRDNIWLNYSYVHIDITHTAVNYDPDKIK